MCFPQTCLSLSLKHASLTYVPKHAATTTRHAGSMSRVLGVLESRQGSLEAANRACIELQSRVVERAGGA